MTSGYVKDNRKNLLTLNELSMGILNKITITNSSVVRKNFESFKSEMQPRPQRLPNQTGHCVALSNLSMLDRGLTFRKRY